MAGDGFTPAQLQQLRQLFREELADCGLRVDGDHQDDARRDFMFLRSLRQATNGIAAKVGWFIIFAILGGILWIFQLGISAWRSAGGP
jgi:hypothetical protein